VCESSEDGVSPTPGNGSGGRNDCP